MPTPLIPRSKNGKQRIDRERARYRVTIGSPARLTRRTAAWTTTVNSGIARMFDPKLRRELGYYYNEFVGIHDNYDRYNQFTEREVLPRLSQGPDAFYCTDGKLLPMFRVDMDLQSQFAADLRRMAQMAHDLRLRLEALTKSQ